jgi:hypothetical protein
MEEQPVLGADLMFLLDIWNRIAGCRPPSFSGVAGIPLTDIACAYLMYGANEFCPTDEFVTWMLYLDGIARDYWAEQEKNKNKKPLIITP